VLRDQWECSAPSLALSRAPGRRSEGVEGGGGETAVVDERDGSSRRERIE